MKHFLQFRDFSRDEFEHLFRRTRSLKDRFKNYVAYQPLVDRMLAMVFEKSSTRTRVSFEAGIHQLGGSSIVLNTSETQLGRGEPIEDVARVVTRMVDLVMIRTFEHAIIERFASQSRVPVINGLTNDYIPANCWPTSIPTSSGAARSRERWWRGSAMATTCATPGSRRRRSSASG